MNLANIDLDLHRFIKISPTENVPYSFYIGKYPVTNAQYERFLNSPDFVDKSLWVNFPKYNENCILIGKWGTEGWDWFQEKTKLYKGMVPRHWFDKDFGISNFENPVVGVTWYEGNAYCNWLLRYWNALVESNANTGLRPQMIRLPLENEWVIAAGGEMPQERYPWDVAGEATTEAKEIIKRANVSYFGESCVGHTTPVNTYFHGASPHGVMDMAGNVLEWQANYSDKDQDELSLRGGAWNHFGINARVAFRLDFLPHIWNYSNGFRVVLFPRE